MITKEICDQNKCPLVPPNCKMFFLTPKDMSPKAFAEDPRLATEIWFSPFEGHAESHKWWSHDSDFPISLRRATGGLREMIGAVALFQWGLYLGVKMTYTEEVAMMYQGSLGWKKWALADPDDDDEDDDDDLPVVFKESK